MCGFIGGTLYDADTVPEALSTIGHRGRDAIAARNYPEHGLWLGHVRLAIQDLTPSANQPFRGRDFSIVFNGELWRRTLDQYGYRSDTKLLAALYDSHRDDPVTFARELDGMFAFVVYDAARSRLVVARDRMGRIPLYYATDPGGIAVASEAKAITAALGYRFAGNGPRPQVRSRVKLFPPGMVMVYDLAAHTVAWHPFAAVGGGTLAACDGDDRGAGYYAAGIRGRLTAAVANESVADVPVCTILSGGIDSTLVTALLARTVPNLRAYTVSVGESNGRDDLAWARRAAAAIGVPLTEVILGRDDVLHGLEAAVWAVEDDRWVQVAPAVPQIALAAAIGRDGYKVVFGGEGSDELFASYGDVRRWSWRPEQYHARRVKLCERLHDNNLIRGNKAMMWGGTVELRTPFLDRELVDFCLRIPTRYRSNDDGRGTVLKPLLREAFRGVVPDDLLMRKKVTFQEGAHSAFLEDYKDVMKDTFAELFSGR